MVMKWWKQWKEQLERKREENFLSRISDPEFMKKMAELYWERRRTNGSGQSKSVG